MAGTGYVKIYESILDSSVWAEPPATRCVWVAMLAMVDADGRVETSPSGLQRRANVTPADFRTAIAALEGPDLESKSPEWGGRRIEKVEGGWVILNYKKYRDLRSPKQIADAERQRKWREEHGFGAKCDITERRGDDAATETVAVAVPAIEKQKAREARFSGGAKKPDTGKAALLLVRIRALAEDNGTRRLIRRDRVRELGDEILKAFDAVGGGERILTASGKDHSFLARDFACALQAAHEPAVVRV